MARVTKPPREHPERATIETAAGGAALAVAAILLGFFVAARHHWQHASDLCLLIGGLLFGVIGIYVFAQFWIPWLPSLPAPRERVAKPKPSAAQDIAKQILKDDGLWPRWWQLRRRFGGGLTLQQYDALRAKELAAQPPSAPPPATQRTSSLAQAAAATTQKAKQDGGLALVAQLLRRGGQLRVKAQGIEGPLDSMTQRFHPMAAVTSQLARAIARSNWAPTDVNQWLQDVAVFVGDSFPEYSDRVVQNGLSTGDPAATIAAVDQNFVVLRLIQSELSK
jgi:transposase